VLEAILEMSSVLFVMAALLSIPFILVKITNLENDNTSKWTRFFKYLSTNYLSARIFIPSCLIGGIIYYFMYAFLQSGSIAHFLMIGALIGGSLIPYYDLFDIQYRWLHLRIFKLLFLVGISLLLVALGYSIWITTFIGFFSFIVISTLLFVEQVLLDALTNGSDSNK